MMIDPRFFAPLLSLIVGLTACHTPEPNDSAHRQARAAQEGEPGYRAQPGSQMERPQAPPANEPPVDPPQAAASPASTLVPVTGPEHPALRSPDLANETAPAHYTVRLDTTKGEILIDVTRSWAPLGADRFYNLVRIGYFNNIAFFRVIEGFMAQVGLSGRPDIDGIWRNATIDDDPQTQSNTRGRVTFATSGRNSRVQQFFINFGDNSRLDSMGFAPFGQVRSMTVVDSLHDGYGEGGPRGQGPSQGRIQSEGNPYLARDFPQLDYIRSASIVTP